MAFMTNLEALFLDVTLYTLIHSKIKRAKSSVGW